MGKVTLVCPNLANSNIPSVDLSDSSERLTCMHPDSVVPNPQWFDETIASAPGAKYVSSERSHGLLSSLVR